MDDTTKRVVTGVELSTKAGATLRDIVSRVEALQSKVHQIASATEEMSSVADHISGDVQSIAVSANEISSGSSRFPDIVGHSPAGRESSIIGFSVQDIRWLAVQEYRGGPHWLDSCGAHCAKACRVEVDLSLTGNCFICIPPLPEE